MKKLSPGSYKRKLYKDWIAGMSVIELAKKYERSIFKVNLILEKARLK